MTHDKPLDTPPCKPAYQPGIMNAVPALARHLFFALESVAQLPDALNRLAPLADGDATVVGLGESLVRAAGGRIDGLRPFPTLGGSPVDIPSTQHGMWCWLRGDDRGELLHRSRRIEAALAPALRLVQATDAFRYGSGLDLIVPQRFHVSQQPGRGDRHVYASRTRFIPNRILERFEQSAWPPPSVAPRPTAESRRLAFDLAERMRSMWK